MIAYIYIYIYIYVVNINYLNLYNINIICIEYNNFNKVELIILICLKLNFN